MNPMNVLVKPLTKYMDDPEKPTSYSKLAMDPRLKQFIQTTLPELKDGTECDDRLLDEMGSQCIFIKSDKETIKFEKTPDSQRSLFYHKIMQKGEGTYEKTIIALTACGQVEAAQLLQKGLNAIKEGEKKSVEEIDFVDNMTPLNVVVKPSTKYMDDPDKDYEMRSAPRGLALIISNTRFANEPEDHRHGGQEDRIYMEKLFKGIGYECDVKTNIKKTELENILESFKEDLERDFHHVDSLVVVVMSHGSRDYIKMSDGSSAHLWNDIVYKFKDSLPNKPKLFIVQACQRFDAPRTQAQNSVRGPMSDTLICFPTQPGSLASRDIYLGTWFIYCLTKVFMENAHDTHLLDLLKMVQTTMYEGVKGEQNKGKHLCDWTDYLFKNVYFNPINYLYLYKRERISS